LEQRNKRHQLDRFLQKLAFHASALSE